MCLDPGHLVRFRPDSRRYPGCGPVVDHDKPGNSNKEWYDALKPITDVHAKAQPRLQIWSMRGVSKAQSDRGGRLLPSPHKYSFFWFLQKFRRNFILAGVDCQTFTGGNLRGLLQKYSWTRYISYEVMRVLESQALVAFLLRLCWDLNCITLYTSFNQTLTRIQFQHQKTRVNTWLMLEPIRNYE
jgi:hypothetical protein